MTMMNTGWGWLRVLVAALLLSALAAGQASAAIVVNSILVNGGSTATVAPGATITVTISVTLTNGTRWRSTAFTTTPPSSLSICSFSPDISVNGTHTRTFTLTAPTANGIYDLNVAAWTNPNCNGSASTTKTLPGGINTGPVVASLNHVRLTHDGSALTCGVETLALKACANATCSTLFTGQVVAALGTGAGTWSANPVTLINGTASVNLTNPNAVDVTLAGTVTSPTAVKSNLVCYLGNTPDSCTLRFNSNSCALDAVEPTAPAQTPIFTKIAGRTVSLDLLALTGGVINPNSTARIVAKLVDDDGSGQCSATVISDTVDITLAGATSGGRRNVSFTPTRASKKARVLLTSGSLTACSSDNFAIRPPSLTVSASGVVTDVLGTNATLLPGLKAGTDTFTLRADGGTGYTGVPMIGQGAVKSSGTKAGIIAGAFGAAPTTNWTATGAGFTYSEVGYFRLTPYAVYDDSFADVDESKVPRDCFIDANLGSATAVIDPNVAVSGRFGCYFGNTVTSSYFGRFTPDRFLVSDGPMINRSGTPSCTASLIVPDFTYMGEEMTASFTLTAVNAAGATTQNYVGEFAKRLLVASALNMGAVHDPATGTRTPYLLCVDPEVHPCFKLGTPSSVFVLGSGSVQAPLTVFRGASPLAPLTDFKVGFAPKDEDGVRVADSDYNLDTVNVVASATGTHALGAVTVMRYGRMGIDNAYGSELLPLRMRLDAQVWNGTAWATNTVDNCTLPAFKPFVTPADYMGGIGSGNMPSANLNPGPMLLAGAGKLSLAKPGPTKPSTKGSVTVRSALPFLPGSGRATFGVYKAGPVIYVRETY